MSKVLRFIFLLTALLIFGGDHLSLIIKEKIFVFEQNNTEKQDENKEEKEEESKEEKDENKEEKDKENLCAINLYLNRNANRLKNYCYHIVFIFDNKCTNLESPPPEA